MRVLLTAHGAYGHVLPLVGVSQALAADGHDVLVATSSEFCGVLAAYGVATVAAGMDDDTVVAQARRRWPETWSRPPAEWTTRMFSEIAGPAMATDLATLIARWRPDIVVREQGEFGGPVAATAAGLPWVTHGWGSPLRTDDSAGAGVLDPCPPSLYRSPPSLVRRRVIRPTMGARAAVRPRTGASARPLAYVGFGTVALFRDAPDLTRAAVRALTARGFRVIVTTPDETLAAQLVAEGNDRVDVRSWIDLGDVLPECALVACHGGAGTVLTALSAGVPLLLLPRGAPSQLRMAAACVGRGVGRTVVWDGTNSDHIDAAADELSSSDQIRSAAAAVADEIAHMPEPSSAADLLTQVVAGRD